MAAQFAASCVLMSLVVCRLFAQEPSRSALDTLIQNIAANEVDFDSISLTGKHEQAKFDETGKVVYAQIDRAYGFLRSGELMREDRKGEIHASNGGKDFTTSPLFDHIYYSPTSTVHFNPNQRIAIRQGVQPPSFFPLACGRTFSFDSEGNIVSFSRFLTESSKLRSIIVARDQKNHGLLLIDDKAERARFKYWIDPARGYLVLKKEIYLMSEDGKQEVLFESVEIKPKLFRNTWFFESAKRVQYNIISQNEETAEVLTDRTEDLITITNCDALTKLQGDELEFSEEAHKKTLDFIFDRVANEITDVRTGRKSSWLPTP